MNKLYRLGEIAKIGSSTRIHLADYVESGIPFYRSKEIIQLSNGQNISESLYISHELYSEIRSKYPVPVKGDILITSVGTIGVSYLVKNEEFYFKDGNLTWLREVNTKIVNHQFLFKWLKSKAFLEQIFNNNIGAVQKALTIDYLKQVKISLPNLKVQQKIASVLSALDDKIELNNKINAELEQMAKTIYDYWFVQFDFPNANGQPYKSSGGKMVWNEELKREVPEGWEVMPLSKITAVSNESVNPMDFPDKEFKYYSIPDFDESSTFKIEKGFEIKSNKYSIKSTDVLVSKLNPWFSRVIYATEDSDLISSTEFVVWRTGNLAMKNYMYMIARDASFVTFCTKSASGTSNSHKRVNPTVMMKYKIVFDETVATLFGNTLGSSIKMLAKNKFENQQLSQLRDWLLPMLMNGQVTVGQAYEKVEELLGMAAEKEVLYKKKKK